MLCNKSLLVIYEPVSMEEEMATHCSILAWKKNPMDREAWRVTVHGVEKSWTTLSDEA